MTKYDENFKIKVVAQYLSRRAGIDALAKEHGLSPSQLRHWVAVFQYHGLDGLSKQYYQHSAQFKISVLERMWREELSRNQIAALYNLSGSSIVGVWERQYHDGVLDASASPPQRVPKQMALPSVPKPATESDNDETRSREELIEELKYLRAEVAYLKKLDALIRARKPATQSKRKPYSD
jgi:transposase